MLFQRLPENTLAGRISIDIGVIKKRVSGVDRRLERLDPPGDDRIVDERAVP